MLFFIRSMQNATVLKIGRWNCDTILILVFNLCYQNLGPIFLIVWKLCAFWQRSNFDNSQQFLDHNCRLKWKLLILKVSSERSSSDLSEYSLYEIEKIFCIYKNRLIGGRCKFIDLFLQIFFSQITSKA